MRRLVVALVALGVVALAAVFVHGFAFSATYHGEGAAYVGPFSPHGPWSITTSSEGNSNSARGDVPPIDLAGTAGPVTVDLYSPVPAPDGAGSYYLMVNAAPTQPWSIHLSRLLNSPRDLGAFMRAGLSATWVHALEVLVLLALSLGLPYALHPTRREPRAGSAGAGAAPATVITGLQRRARRHLSWARQLTEPLDR